VAHQLPPGPKRPASTFRAIGVRLSCLISGATRASGLCPRVGGATYIHLTRIYGPKTRSSGGDPAWDSIEIPDQVFSTPTLAPGGRVLYPISRFSNHRQLSTVWPSILQAPYNINGSGGKKLPPRLNNMRGSLTVTVRPRDNAAIGDWATPTGPYYRGRRWGATQLDATTDRLSGGQSQRRLNTQAGRVTWLVPDGAARNVVVNLYAHRHDSNYTRWTFTVTIPNVDRAPADDTGANPAGHHYGGIALGA